MASWELQKHAESIKSIETFRGRTSEGVIHLAYYFENVRTLKGLEMVVGKGTNMRLIDGEEYDSIVDKIEAMPKWCQLDYDGPELKAKDLKENQEKRRKQLRDANKLYREKKKSAPEKVAARESLKAQIERRKEEERLKMEERQAKKAKKEADEQAKRDAKKEKITEDQYVKAAWEIKAGVVGASMAFFTNRCYDKGVLEELMKTITKSQYVEACTRLFGEIKKDEVNLEDTFRE